MTGVLSKHLDRASEALGTDVRKYVVAAAAAVYYIKIVHPYILNVLAHNNALNLAKQIVPKVASSEDLVEGLDQKAIDTYVATSVAAEKKKVPSVNREFLRQLKKLLKVMVPSLWSKESFVLTTHTLTLVVRTFISIYVAMLEV